MLRPGRSRSWLTPITMVMSSLVAGAEMMTFLAPPSTCARALVASVKKPVDSMTTSAPRSPHCRLAGSRSANAAIVLVADRDRGRRSSVTSASSRPRIESYFSRWARDGVVGEVVDADDLDVGAGGAHGAEEVAADAAEAVDAYANGHGEAPLSGRLVVVGPLGRGACHVVSTLSPRGPDGSNRSSAVRAGNRRPRRSAPAASDACVFGEHLRGQRRPRCRGCRAPRPACRPSPAAGGSGRRSRPW